MKRLLLLIILGLCTVLHAQTWRVMSYNVENLFDHRHDTLKADTDFTPNGIYRWTAARSKRKAEQIARVICLVGGWDTPLLVGLCEVENSACLDMLTRCLPSYPYRYIHQESPDSRGIDVALLYDTTRFVPLIWEALPVDLDSLYTRDILYTMGTIPTGDTMHVMVCHMPSMRGGKAQSDWKRERAKQVLQTQVSKILQHQPQAYIIVMGDMNDSPKDDVDGLTNLMTDISRQGRGTYKWQGAWSCLDQFYLSSSLLPHCRAGIYDAAFLLEPDRRYTGKQPLRTFRGLRYNAKGYSDHLPVILDVSL